MKKNNAVALMAAYYLSKFDRLGYVNLGIGRSMSDTHKQIGRILGVNPNSVKNMRDEFDPLHDNPRKGWFQRQLRPSRQRVVQQLEELGEAALRNIILDALGDPSASKSHELTKIIALVSGTNKPHSPEQSDDNEESPNLKTRQPLISGQKKVIADESGEADILADFDQGFVDELYEESKKNDNSFEKYFARLENLVDTDSDRQGKHTSRREQQILRALLFKDFDNVQCAICHRTLPIDLMVAAHIKPRSKCSLMERMNPNVVMPLCKIGCDEFFERGYVIINKNGLIELNKKALYSSELRVIVQALTEKRCTHFRRNNRHFFDYKRQMFE